MPDKRVTVWVCHFKDRASLMLQWLDPDTGRTKSRSAKTGNEKEVEQARADLEFWPRRQYKTPVQSAAKEPTPAEGTACLLR